MNLRRLGQTIALMALLVSDRDCANEALAQPAAFQRLPSYGVPASNIQQRNAVEIVPSHCSTPARSCTTPGPACGKGVLPYTPPLSTSHCNAAQSPCHAQPAPCQVPQPVPCHVPQPACPPQPTSCNVAPPPATCPTAPTPPQCSPPLCQPHGCLCLPCFQQPGPPAPCGPPPCPSAANFMIFKQAVMADGGAAVDSADDTINYTITIVNVGSKCLTGPSIRDALTANHLEPITDIGARGVLDAGETWTIKTYYRVRQSDIDNNGIDVNGHPDNDGDIDNAVTASFGGVPSQTAYATVPVTRKKTCSPTHEHGGEECNCCVHCCKEVRDPYVVYVDDVMPLCADIYEAETISRPYCEAECLPSDTAKCRERMGVETIRELVPRKREIIATYKKPVIAYRMVKKCVKCGVVIKNCPDEEPQNISQYYENADIQPAVPNSATPPSSSDIDAQIPSDGGPNLTPQSLDKSHTEMREGDQPLDSDGEKVAKLASGAHQPVPSPKPVVAP